ncbi:hypothetical protein N7528_007339 [Penicillium herquei]|nr:hypothetical protein N7528_007339 [Penicillium herquei]
MNGLTDSITNLERTVSKMEGDRAMLKNAQKENKDLAKELRIVKKDLAELKEAFDVFVARQATASGLYKVKSGGEMV